MTTSKWPTYQFVTSFSPAGYECYGKKFVTGFGELWPQERCELVVYHESQQDVLLFDNVRWRNLDFDLDRALFIAQNKDRPERVNTAREPNSQAVRFCHKIFAITDAAKSCRTDWLVWVDADVETTRKVTLQDLATALPEKASLSFLGRPWYRYSECGWVGYRVSEQPVQALLADMRHVYTHGELFTLDRTCWHDSKVFDICRERSSVPKERQVSLVGPQRDTHVWRHSPLSQWTRHNKGPCRKQAAYGHVVP